MGRSLALEGFSEDLNQDGFVDPIVPAAPAPVVVPAPVARIATPVAVAPQVAFPAPVAALPQVAAPLVNAAPAPVAVAGAPHFANQPLFHAAAFPQVAAPVFKTAAVAAPVFSAPVTTVQHVAPAAPVVTRTISPIPVPFRHAPVAHVFDSRLHA